MHVEVGIGGVLLRFLVLRDFSLGSGAGKIFGSHAGFEFIGCKYMSQPIECRAPI